MSTLEQKATEFISAFNSGNKAEISRTSTNFSEAIESNEWQLCKTSSTYLLSRALYYLVDLPGVNHANICKLLYFCLLRNYLDKQNSILHSDYSDLIGGCQLAFVTIYEFGYPLAEIVSNESASLSPEKMEKQLLNQLYFFGGIIKQANIEGFHNYPDIEISNKFTSFLNSSGIDANLPTGNELDNIKSIYTPNLKNIYLTIKDGLRGYPLDENDVLDYLGL